MISYIIRCKSCRRQFERLYEEMARDICYKCALEELCGNSPPEEGDFNSAMIISGEMTEQQEKWLQEDLKSVDHSRVESEWSRMVEEYDDANRWDYLKGRDDDE